MDASKFPDLSLILAIYFFLLVFGIIFNMLTEYLERKRYMEGYTAFAVVAGVGITVAVTAVFSWTFALLTIGAFAASGLPMIVGSVWRHIQARQREQEELRKLLAPTVPRKRIIFPDEDAQ